MITWLIEDGDRDPGSNRCSFVMFVFAWRSGLLDVYAMSRQRRNFLHVRLLDMAENRRLTDMAEERRRRSFMLFAASLQYAPILGSSRASRVG